MLPETSIFKQAPEVPMSHRKFHLISAPKTPVFQQAPEVPMSHRKFHLNFYMQYRNAVQIKQAPEIPISYMKL